MIIRTLCILIIASACCYAQPGGDEGGLAGEIKDLHGKPIKDVKIELVHTKDSRRNITLTSNKRGRFSARSMTNGVVILKASKDGYISREYRYKQAQSKQQVSFAMVAVNDTAESIGEQAKVSGTVTDIKGKPIEGVELKFTSPDLPFYKKTVTTDAKGRFETSGIELMKIKIVGNKEGYAPYAYEFQQGDKPYKLKKFELQPIDANAEGSNSAIKLYNSAVGPYQAGDFEEAERLVKEALKVKPDMTDAMKIAVFTNAELKDWPEVVKYAEMYLAVNPGDEQITKYALEGARMSGDTEKLNAMKEEMKRSGAMSPEMMFNEAVTHINAGKDSDAAKVLDEIITMDPNYSIAYYHLGKIKVREYEFEDAIKYLKKHLEIDPGSKYKAEVEDLINTLAE